MKLMRYYFLIFFIKHMLWVLIWIASTCWGNSNECPQHIVEAIQMSTHNICFYKEIDKSTLAVILKLRNWLEASPCGSSNEYQHTHNICFHEEIRKISILFGWKLTLSGAMLSPLHISIWQHNYKVFAIDKMVNVNCLIISKTPDSSCKRVFN